MMSTTYFHMFVMGFFIYVLSMFEILITLVINFLSLFVKNINHSLSISCKNFIPVCHVIFIVI